MLQTGFSDASLRSFIEQQTREPLYYSQAWLDLLASVFGYSVTACTTTDAAGQITGFLPLCRIQSPLLGFHLVSLPFSDNCPLLAKDETSASELVDQATRVAQEQGAKYLELRTGLNDVLARRPDVAAGDLYVRWLKPLTADADVAWESLTKSVRQKIKQARRLGVQVRMAQCREDMEHYYRLHLLTRSKKHGMPAQSRQYFYALWDAFAPCGALQLWLAEHEGVVVAASVSLTSGATIRCAYNSSDQRYLSLAPNHLLMWTIIAWACAHAYSMLDMGRTACANEGLMEFKRRLGAVAEPLPYYYYPRRTGLATTCQTNWTYRLLTACWKRLPLTVSGPLGGYLYKHLG